MLRKLRRSTTQVTKRKDSVSTIATTDSTIAILDPTTTTTTTTATPSKEPLTFFSLPAELRNEILAHIAHTTPLTLHPTPLTKTLRTHTPPPVPPLLLASRRLRTEALPLLLSRSLITTSITPNCDFRPLIRSLAGLYATELKALRANPRLRVRLCIDHPSRARLGNLRVWAANRAEGLDRIGWGYDVVLVENGGTAFAKRGAGERWLVLWDWCKVLAVLEREVGELVGWEIGAVRAAVEWEREREAGGNAREGF